MNTQKWLGVVIVAVVLVAAAYFIGQSSNNQPQPVATPIPINNTSTQSTAQPSSTAQNTNQSANNTSTSYVENNLPNTPTSIDQKSVNQGWMVIPLGANQMVQLDTSFSDTITDLGQAIPEGSISWAPLSSYPTTTGKYVQVNLTVNNLSLNNEGLEIVFAGVFDQAGRYYQYMMGNSTCGNFDATEGTQTLSPDIPCIMNALFEVGQDSNSFTLKLYIKKDY